VHEALLPNPTSPYAVSKLAAEGYVQTIGELWGIETVCLRIFNTYGSGQAIPPTHPPVIPQFMRQTLQGGSLVVYGTGEQKRDYIYIDDVVEALAAAAVNEGLNRQVINIGTGAGTSLNALVRLIERVTGREADVITNPSIPGGTGALVADTTKATKLLGFAAKIPLVEGLALLKVREPQLLANRLA
jgi:UDP-glucose 4-epimerase